MSRIGFSRTAVAGLAVVSVASGLVLLAQSQVAPTNDAPNPYEMIEGWAKMPDGRAWGSTSAVDIAPDGKSVWVAERCGQNSCLDNGQPSPLDTVFLFDESGNLVRSFGQGLIAWPHGIHVDADGNVWVADGRTNLPAPARGRRGGGEAPAPAPMPDRIYGYQILKFSPTGELLLTVGKPGGNVPGEEADPASLYQPNDVITNANGDIFVAEGHSSREGAHARVSKFDKDGNFIKAWGSFGTGPGEFDQPHGLAFDSQGRLFIADRGNDRIQIYDQDGNLLEGDWMQYSRLSGIWIDDDDLLYGADSESGSVAPERPEWERGIRIGRIADGKNGEILAFIPDQSGGDRGTLAAEGVAVDRDGIIYGAEVGPRSLKRYVRR